MGLYRKDIRPPTWTKTQKREKADEILANLSRISTETLRKSAAQPERAMRKGNLLLEAMTALRRYRDVVGGTK